MLTLSIIVPIYNVDPFLKECIDSILLQTMTDFELILVNDGSTDRSGEICNDYSKVDSRIKVIHQTNKGVSSARNTGMFIAQGSYIAFIDPDDTIEPNMYEILTKFAVKFKTDLVVCPIKTINTINNTISVTKIWDQFHQIINKDSIINNIMPSILNNQTYSLTSCVNKLYKKSLFDKFNIKFDENINHSEDARLNFNLLTLINDLVFVDKPLYNYFIRERVSLTRLFREDLFSYARDNKNFMIALCKKLDMEVYIPNVSCHYTGIILSYMEEVVCSKLVYNQKNKILSDILNNKEFIKDLRNYKCPSNFYKLIKVVCFTKNESLLTKIIVAKNRFQYFLQKVG